MLSFIPILSKKKTHAKDDNNHKKFKTRINSIAGKIILKTSAKIEKIERKAFRLLSNNSISPLPTIMKLC